MALSNRNAPDKVVLEALTTEIRVHQFVFVAILVPLYVLIVPLHSIEITIIALYDMARQFLYKYFSTVIVSKEEINFRGYYFRYFSIALELLCFLALLAAFRTRIAGLFLRTGPFDGLARGRRMQPMPPPLLSRYGDAIGRAWRGSGYPGDRPKLYCFAAKGAIASAFEADGSAALGLSSGLLHRLNSGIDPTVEVMLQHEFAHISYNDNYQFDQILAIAKACRSILLGLASLVFVTFVGYGFVGATTTGSLEPGDAPYLAYLKEALASLLYSVCVVIAVARYASLVVMLRELRADVRAGLAVGGLERFVSTIAGDRTVKQDGWTRLVSTLVGANVTHLTAAERLQYLQEPTRLLIPKFRYFAYSIALPLLLVMTDWVSLSDAQWILNVGILAVVLSGNLLIFLMLTDLGRNQLQIAFSRRIMLALSCLALNTMLFIDLYDVMESAGEFLDDIFVPGIGGSPDPAGRIVRLGKAIIHPYWTAILDGRLLLWLALIFGAIHLAWKTSSGTSRSVASHILLLGIIGVGTVVQWRLSVQGRYTSRWWPIGDAEGTVSYWLGPATCACFVAVMATLARSLLRSPVNDQHLAGCGKT